MILSDAKAYPILMPAMERDFENVCTTMRFSYFLRSGMALSPPKSTYASSTITTLSGLFFMMNSTSDKGRLMDVGALGLAITMPPFS